MALDQANDQACLKGPKFEPLTDFSRQGGTGGGVVGRCAAFACVVEQGGQVEQLRKEKFLEHVAEAQPPLRSAGGRCEREAVENG